MPAPSILVLPLIAAALLVGSSTAGAAVKPPDAKLRTKGDSAPLGTGTYQWSYPSNRPGVCTGVQSDGVASYEPLIEVSHNHAKTSVVFFRNRRPTVEQFRAHSTLTRHGRRAGRGKSVAHRVQPRRIDGTITSWKIVFRADAAKRPYLDLSVSFEPRGECNEGGGGFYTFGVARGG